MQFPKFLKFPSYSSSQPQPRQAAIFAVPIPHSSPQRSFPLFQLPLPKASASSQNIFCSPVFAGYSFSSITLI